LLCQHCKSTDRHYQQIDLTRFQYPKDATDREELLLMTNFQEGLAAKFEKLLRECFREVKSQMAFKISFIFQIVRRGREFPDRIG
jgi:hypothetical protein